MMNENNVEFFLQKLKSQVFEDPSHLGYAIYDVLHALRDWTRSQIKDLQDAQAHQQSKERRREERLAESEEGPQNACESRCEDGQEAGKVQRQSSEIYQLAHDFAWAIHAQLGRIKYTAQGQLDEGQNFKVSVELE